MRLGAVVLVLVVGAGACSFPGNRANEEAERFSVISIDEIVKEGGDSVTLHAALEAETWYSGVYLDQDRGEVLVVNVPTGHEEEAREIVRTFGRGTYLQLRSVPESLEVFSQRVAETMDEVAEVAELTGGELGVSFDVTDYVFLVSIIHRSEGPDLGMEEDEIDRRMLEVLARLEPGMVRYVGVQEHHKF